VIDKGGSGSQDYKMQESHKQEVHRRNMATIDEFHNVNGWNEHLQCIGECGGDLSGCVIACDTHRHWNAGAPTCFVSHGEVAKADYEKKLLLATADGRNEETMRLHTDPFVFEKLMAMLQIDEELAKRTLDIMGLKYTVRWNELFGRFGKYWMSYVWIHQTHRKFEKLDNLLGTEKTDLLQILLRRIPRPSYIAPSHFHDGPVYAVH